MAGHPRGRGSGRMGQICVSSFPIYFLVSSQCLCCPACHLVRLWPDGSEHPCVSAFCLHVGGGKQNQKSWARAGLAPTAFLRGPFPLNHLTALEEPVLGSGCCSLHRHSNTCLPKVGPPDWGILLSTQGSFACVDNRQIRRQESGLPGVGNSATAFLPQDLGCSFVECNWPFFSFSAEMAGALCLILL